MRSARITSARRGKRASREGEGTVSRHPVFYQDLRGRGERGLQHDTSMKLLAASILASTLCVWTVQAQKVTAYGYPGDTTGDSNSRNGIGNHENTLIPYGSASVTSAAVSAEFANQYGLGLGQEFKFTAANGQTFDLKYDDTVPTGGPNQQPAGAQVVDVFDPQSRLTNGGNDNNFSTNVQGDTLTPGTGQASSAPMGQGGLGMIGVGTTAPSVGGLVDQLLGQFKAAGSKWQSAITSAASNLFWILALISFVVTFGMMCVRHEGLVAIFAELCRFLFWTGFAFWVLTNGADFAQRIIDSCSALGGLASGTDTLNPANIVGLAFQVVWQTSQNINLLFPQSAIFPVLLAIIILVTLTLVAVNMIVLLCSAWVVVYAGLIFLGFGGCRWLSDMAINYYRTILGIGVAILTMELIISIGATFLQNIITTVQSSNNPVSLMVVAVASIILLVISHRIPMMVANIVTGAAHNGGIGALGALGAFGAVMGLGGMARGLAAGGVAAASASASNQKLMDRIGASEGVSGNGAARSLGMASPGASGVAGNGIASPSGSGGSSGSPGPATYTGAALSYPGAPKNWSKSAGAKRKAQLDVVGSDPPLSKPMSPDEQWEAKNPEKPKES